MIWKHTILLYFKNHNNQLIDRIIRAYNQDRDGEEIQEDNLKECIYSFVEIMADDPLQLYIEEFEMPLEISTKSYYIQESAIAIQDLTIPKFIEKVKRYFIVQGVFAIG